MGIFHVFKIVQMVPNPSTHNILSDFSRINSYTPETIEKRMVFWPSQGKYMLINSL